MSIGFSGGFRVVAYPFERRDHARIVVVLKPLGIELEDERLQAIVKVVDESSNILHEWQGYFEKCHVGGYAAAIDIGRDVLISSTRLVVETPATGTTIAGYAPLSLFHARIVTSTGAPCSQGKAVFELLPGCRTSYEYTIGGGELTAYVPSAIYHRVHFECNGEASTWWNFVLDQPEVYTRIHLGKIVLNDVGYGGAPQRTVYVIFKPISYPDGGIVDIDTTELDLAGYILNAKEIVKLGNKYLVMFRAPSSIAAGYHYARLRACKSGICGETLLSLIPVWP